MKKTLTVNISGVVFHIDEDAYHVLHDYLQSIKKHFSRTEGGDEIISDIEARIAEMLKDRIGDERQVITIEDIEEVIKIIGMPEEFGEVFEEENTNNSSGQSGKASKRLYRDPENAILSGVCGGLGAYFHTDPVWFRLAFVVLSIIGFGTPLLVYIILWIVVPEARTAAERLEMRGERVNVSNIEKSIKEEINNLKDKFNEFTKEAKQTYKKKSAAHRSDIQQVENAFQQILHVFVRIVLIFSGIILAMIGISLVIAFLVMFFGLGYDVMVFDSDVAFVSINRLADLFLGSFGNSMLLRVSLLLLIAIPIAMLLYGGIKLIFGLDRTRYVGITAFNIWIVSLIITSVYGFRIFRDFSNKGIIEKSTTIELTSNKTLQVKLVPDDNFSDIERFGEYVEIDDSNIILTSEEENLFYGLPIVEFEKSLKNYPEMKVYYQARGKNKPAAEERASQIKYTSDARAGMINLGPVFELADHATWRSQEVLVVISIPEGTILNIDEKLRPIISKRKHSPYRLAGKTWIMSEYGLEEASDLEPLFDINESSEDYTAEPEKVVENAGTVNKQNITIRDVVLVNTRQMFNLMKGVFSLAI
ncbi:MAG: PspC domain-containing protein [Bacteroidales bacterium]|nr:PspC domain-containing protein [Bacteroidales bacterium]